MKLFVILAVLVGLAVAEEEVLVAVNAPFSDEHAAELHVPKQPPGVHGHRARRAATCGVPTTLTAAQQTASVTIHNFWRAKETASNMINLVWSDEMSRVAQAYANQCIWAHGMLYDCSNNRVGQNLFVTANAAGYPALNITDVVTQWNNERNYWNFATATCATGQECGHYTQNVNARSAQVGCGFAQCPTITVSGQTWKNAILVVCDYTPPGNVQGQAMFVSGPTCSNCDSDNTGAGYKCQNNLCTKCTPATDPACKCGTPLSCQNGMNWDATKCACNCGGQYYGPSCEYQCTCGDSASADCLDWSVYCTDPGYLQFMTGNCKKTCGFACNLPSTCTTS
jgi:hypothetical protein